MSDNNEAHTHTMNLRERIADLERQLKHMTNLYNTAAEADQIRKQEHTSLERQLAEYQAPNEHDLLREDWEALPQRVKDYIADIETNADPGSTVQDLFAARENVAGLTAKLAEAKAEMEKVSSGLEELHDSMPECGDDGFCPKCRIASMMRFLDDALDQARGETTTHPEPHRGSNPTTNTNEWKEY